MARFMVEEEANIPSGRMISPGKEMRIDELKKPSTIQKNTGESDAKEISDTFDERKQQDVSNFEYISYEGFDS